MAGEIRRRFPLPPQLEEEISGLENLNRLPGGWCPPVKQRVLTHLILKHRCQRAVEIGVFQGGSFLPCAAAMRHTGGSIVGIDPYSSEAAEEHDNAERVVGAVGDAWHLRIPWDQLYQRVLDEIRVRGWQAHAQLIRRRSDEAAGMVAAPLDFLHIDGNHDDQAVAADIAAYVPKVRSGGLIVLDDTDWDTVYSHYEKLRSRNRVVYEADAAANGRPPWGVLEVP